MEKCSQARDSLESSVQLLGAKLQAALREEVGLVNRIQKLEADKAELEELRTAAVASGHEAIKPLQAKLEACQVEVAGLQNVCAEVRSRSTVIGAAKYSELNYPLIQATARAERLEKELNTLKHCGAQNEKEKSDLVTQLESAQGAQRALVSQLANSEKRREELEVELNVCRQELGAARSMAQEAEAVFHGRVREMEKRAAELEAAREAKVMEAIAMNEERKNLAEKVLCLENEVSC